ncbi:DUF6717 family protein [Gimesia maris]|uniref:Uncharacterized protein n=1 Tax=Gimesia maris TaxID=122 RepID=A0ABX5YSA9_9PLAN|nr:DUF6717 family protein [Gimesia maris]EDL61921.1 hypothetical protein PM8797T_21718 [Gimesia maris DSM 8797]QEG18523.1 hypothetical protein GmarT_44130 [Gimesia maris]
MIEENRVQATAPPQIHWRRMYLISIGMILIAVGIAWQFKLLPPFASGLPRQNAIMVIAPYRHLGTWVFDDSSAGLVQEPFVAGVPEMIDVIVKDIPDADKGFRLLFSAKPFPQYQKKLIWLRGAGEGNYYRFEDSDMEGWICPAMFKYYETAPKELYVKAEPMK